MARKSTKDIVTDAFGDPWAVRERRDTDHGFALCLGWPADDQRGRGGARVILTKRLAAYLEQQRHTPREIHLPIGGTAIKRLRRILGHHWRIDRATWWEERADDLADLTLEAFADRHGVSPTAALAARHAIYGPALRPAAWWRQPDVAAIILSDAPRADIADALGLSVGSVGRLRWALKTMPKPPASWETDPRPLAECLQAWRAAHGWTRDQAAAELRTPPLTVRGWFEGRPCRHEPMVRRAMDLIDEAKRET